MQDFLSTAATLTEAAIALFIILGVCTMPRRRSSPGQLEIDFAAPAPMPVPIAPPELQGETAAIPDPWELPAPAAVEPAPAPLFPAIPYLLALPAAAPSSPAWAEMNPSQLRQECQRQGIKWRNAHGKNKHLGKREMVEALSQTAIAA